MSQPPTPITTEPDKEASEYPELSTAARGGLRSLIFRVLTAASDSLVVVVTARGFGPEGRGIYTLTSFAVTSLVLILGGPQMPMRAEVGRKRTPLGVLHATNVALSGAVLAMAVAVIPLLFVIWPGTDVPIYAALATPFLLLTQLQWSLYQAQGDVRRMHYVVLARSVVPLIALTIVAIAAPDQIGPAMLLWAASQIVVPFVTLGAESRQARLQWHGVVSLLKRLIRRGIPASLANGLTLVGYRMDLIVVATFLSVADVGRYSIAMAAGELLFMLSRSVLTGAYEQLIASDFEESIRVAVRAIRHTLGLLVPVGLLIGLLALPLAGPILGEDFSGSWKLILLLVPGFIAVSVGELMGSFFLVRVERSREVLITSTAAALANLVLASILVRVLGLQGVAIATSVSYTLAIVYLLVRFRHLGGPPHIRDYLPGREEAEDYRRIAAYLDPRRVKRLLKSDAQG